MTEALRVWALVELIGLGAAPLAGVLLARLRWGEVQPAEEAAMHITGEPPLGDGDGYVD